MPDEVVHGKSERGIHRRPGCIRKRMLRDQILHVPGPVCHSFTNSKNGLGGLRAVHSSQCGG